MYQIIFFLPECPTQQKQIPFLEKSDLQTHFLSSESLHSNIVLLFGDDEQQKFNPAFPTIAFYLRGTADIPQELDFRIKELLAEDVMFVPCCPRLSDFAEYVPPLLNEYQGMEIHDDIESFLTNAKNAALSYFHLLGSPKIFISYSQREKTSTQFALELFEGLSQRRYAPFLDTRCIQAPSHFQQFLEEELWDADIVILLDSEQAQQSEWCQREATLAMEASMGVIRVEWPGVNQIKNFPLIENVKLQPNDFCSPQQRHHTITTILNMVDKLRARAHAARHKKLFDKISVKTSLKLIPNHQRKCYYYGPAAPEQSHSIVPIVGIPRSQDFHRAHDALSGREFELAYMPPAHITNTTRHIQWLSQQLGIPVKAY